MLRLFHLIPILSLITILNVLYVGSQENDYGEDEMKIFNELPTKYDFEKYFRVLEGTVSFIDTRPYYMDFNMALGIFLANEQLKSMSAVRVYPPYKARLEHMMTTLDKVMRYFKNKVKWYKEDHKEQTKSESHLKVLSIFFGNDTTWPKQLPKFQAQLLTKTLFYTEKHIRKLYYEWPVYVHFLVNKTAETANLFDNCFYYLSKNPVNNNSTLPQCDLPQSCRTLIVYGPHFGYVLAHRIFYFFVAQYGRRCTVLSEIDDNRIVEILSARMFNEAEYIVSNRFMNVDLFMDMIAVASLHGNAQFLRRTWLDPLLAFQVKEGCFNSHKRKTSVVKQNSENVEWRLFNNNSRILQGRCNGHTTSNAFITFASAVRYIMENFD